MRNSLLNTVVDFFINRSIAIILILLLASAILSNYRSRLLLEQIHERVELLESSISNRVRINEELIKKLEDLMNDRKKKENPKYSGLIRVDYPGSGVSVIIQSQYWWWRYIICLAVVVGVLIVRRHFRNSLLLRLINLTNPKSLTIKVGAFQMQIMVSSSA